MAHIVTLTLNPSIDLATEVDRVEPDIKMRCDRPRRDPGGGAINVSRAIRELGGHSTAVVAAGGPLGSYLVQLLEEAGLDLHAVPLEANTRENLTIIERGGRQFRFNMPGGPVSQAECGRCIAALRAISPPPDYLVLSGSLPDGAPPDFYARVMREFAGQPTRVVLDTSGTALRGAVAGKPFLLKCNRRELGQLIDGARDTVEEATAGAKALVDRGLAHFAVVSMGSIGAVGATANDQWFVAAPPVQPQSQIGAGDSMVAAMTLALSKGASFQEALLHGVAAGTAAVLTPGTQLVRRADYQRLLSGLKSTGVENS